MEIAKVLVVPLGVIAGLTRNPWLRMHGCRVEPGMTTVDEQFPSL